MNGGEETMKKRIHRHGDVELKQIDKLPDGAKVLKDKVLAYGEVTGHSHRFEDPSTIERYSLGDRVFLQVFSPSILNHEEHGTQNILPGVYEQIQEREYNYIDEEMVKVVD